MSDLGRYIVEEWAEDYRCGAMDRAGVVHEIVVENGADHAFFNDTGDRYNARAAQDAWPRVLAWFSRYLSGP